MSIMEKVANQHINFLDHLAAIEGNSIKPKKKDKEDNNSDTNQNDQNNQNAEQSNNNQQK